jgi:REP element-mobilizing transposase RayT
VCHVTARILRGLPSLRSRCVVRALEETFPRGCERPEFRLAEYSVQSNHLHFVVEADGADALGRGMRALLIRAALAANRVWGRRGPVMAGRYHARLLRTPREVRHALRYVVLNAVKHMRAWRSRPELDPASSARWFEGWAEPQLSAPDPPAVARPRFWLLSAGWMRWGRIDLAEAPASVR